MRINYEGESMETTEYFYKLLNYHLEFDDYICSGIMIKSHKSYVKKEDQLTIPGYIRGLQVKRIGENAFENDNIIKNIIIEKGITAIESNAFRGCSKLTEIELPDGLLEINSWAFSFCKKLEKIQFPESIYRISSNAFTECKKLTSVFIPKGIIDLCTDTFSGCSNLIEIIVDEENLEYSSLEGVLFNKEKTVLVEYPAGKNEKNYIVPDTVIGIDTGAFLNCKKLITVTLPGSLLDLLTCAFLDCDKLKKVIVQEDNYRFKDIDGVLFDKELKTIIFYPQGKKETDYSIPDGIECIKEDAFRLCKKIKNVTFPESLKIIERDAFFGCENLTSIILPKYLMRICSYAFNSCMNLKKVTLSRNTKIGHKAFDDFRVEFDYLD